MDYNRNEVGMSVRPVCRAIELRGKHYRLVEKRRRAANGSVRVGKRQTKKFHKKLGHC